MTRIIRAQLDDDADRIRGEIQARFGWINDQIVREGIKVIAGLMLNKPGFKIVGLGQFESGVPDLGSKKPTFYGSASERPADQ